MQEKDRERKNALLAGGRLTVHRDKKGNRGVGDPLDSIYPAFKMVGRALDELQFHFGCRVRSI